MLTIQMDMLQTAALAMLLFLLGRFIVNHVDFLNRCCIPAPVVGGLIFAILHLVTYQTGILTLEFNETLKDAFMDFFFTSVGFGASIKLLKKGALPVLIFLLLATIMVTIQDLVGVGMAGIFDLDGRMGLCMGSVPLVGGHGTSASFGKLFEEAGVDGALTVAVACATYGLVAGSLMGGPLGRWKIKKYNLKPVILENVTKAGLGNTPDAQYLNEHMIELLFSNDCVNEKRNTQAIEVKPNVLVSARVLEHTAAAQIPFDQVKAQIIAKLKADAAVAAAKAEGEKKLAALRAKPDDAGFTAAAWVSRQQPMGQPPELVSAELRIPASKLPAYVGTTINGVGYVIAHVTASDTPKVTDDELKDAKAELAKLHGGADMDAYIGGLKGVLKAKVLNKDYVYPAKKGSAPASSPAAK